MDSETLRQAVEQAGAAAAGMEFLAGLVFSFNLVSLASIPVSFAYVTKGRDKNNGDVHSRHDPYPRPSRFCGWAWWTIGFVFSGSRVRPNYSAHF
jgi:hypothetical protein